VIDFPHRQLLMIEPGHFLVRDPLMTMRLFEERLNKEELPRRVGSWRGRNECLVWFGTRASDNGCPKHQIAGAHANTKTAKLKHG
jgi:hypothetical protein